MKKPKNQFTFPVKISSHLKKLAEKNIGIKKQFYLSKKEALVNYSLDPLNEENYLKTKGLYHKYENRVLILLTDQCASYCRFCTRKRNISNKKSETLNNKDIENIIDYLKNHSQINEVIFSGGDPLMAQKTLEIAIKQIGKLKQIKIIRIHTRVPVSNPALIKKDFFKTLSEIEEQAVYLSIHFEHPAEIIPKTIKIIKQLRKSGVILLSQTVFLKGINDNFETLNELFTKLSQIGVRPYCIFRCDPVVGSEHFIVPIEKEIEIMTKLRKNLSGIAYPLYAIDAPNGVGKIPVPLNYWNFDFKKFKDFDGKEIKTSN
jgi:lysine 2,3-aminomutase